MTRSQTRGKPYSEGIVSKNKRSESKREESLRTTVQDEPEIYDEITPTEPMTVDKQRKPRRKMLPAPIEKLDEFSVADYLKDLSTLWIVSWPSCSCNPQISFRISSCYETNQRKGSELRG